MTKRAFLFWVAMALILMCGLTIYFWPQPTVPEAAANSAPTPTPVPVTSPASDPPATQTAPAAPEPWRYPAGTRIGSVDLGGLSEEEAAAALRQTYEGAASPLTLVAPGNTFVIKPADIDLALPIDQMLSATRERSAESDAPIRVPFQPTYDLAKIQARVAALSPTVALSPAIGLDRSNWTFVLTPGSVLDEGATVAAITATLDGAAASRRVPLATTPITGSLRATPEQVLAALAAREQKWGGVIGVSVYDIHSGASLEYHGDTVFSGMSVLKIPILLQSYISREKFTKGQEAAIELMITISDNDASNELLEMIGDGDGLEGTQRLDATLSEVLGLRYTTLAAPFESIDYLSKVAGIEIPQRGQEGEEPYTDADPYVRSSPNEMTRVMAAIVQCAYGQGPLVGVPDSALTPARCKEMLNVLAQNEDTNKIVAGVPADAFVAHKSGWIDDARADSGYVRAADGSEYIISIWMWDVDYIPTEVSDPLLSSLSRIVYTAQHPVVASGSR